MEVVKENVQAWSSLPFGMTDFSILRRLNKIYVDKSSQIYNLAQSEGYYFLSRPRRFGKTLLVSTFASRLPHNS